MSGPGARRGRYAFLTTGRWVALVSSMVVVSVVCAFLGTWQWARYESRSADAARVDTAYDANPVALSDALAAPAGPVTAAAEWQPVELSGHYLQGGTVLLRNRPVGGTPAVHVVAPFVARAGDEEVLVVVDRGWVGAAEGEGTRTDLPQPPAGEVTLTGRLRVAEEPVDRGTPTGQVYTLAPGQVLAGVATVTDLGDVAELPVLDGHVVAAAEDPAPEVALGGYARPEFRYGTNLSYAFQWWFFSAGALVALVILARREAAENEGTVPVRRARSAEVEEDALVDAQLAVARAAAAPGATGGPTAGTPTAAAAPGATGDADATGARPAPEAPVRPA